MKRLLHPANQQKIFDPMQAIIGAGLCPPPSAN
jgi:hypothetical protein